MSESVVSFFGVIAYAASWQFVVPLVVLLFVWFSEVGALTEAKTLFFSLAGSEALVFAVKILVNAPRPTNALVVPEDPWSFPSAHSTAAVVLYGLLAFFLWQRPEISLTIKIIAVVCAVILAILVCMSRVVLQVHHMIDVVVGAAIGLAFLAFGMWYFLRNVA